MAKLAELFTELTVRDRKFKKGMKGARLTVEKMKGSLEGLNRAANIALIGIGAAAAAMTIFVRDASDAEEEASKFAAVFKEQTAAAQAFAEALAKDTGRSIFEIKKNMAGIQDTFVPLGFARDKAREMSQALTQLAIDVASFQNKTEAEVIRDFQSALVGNTETVRKYGIIITQATLNQELLNSGIEGGVKAATEAQKVQARMTVIFKGTTDAQGDAIRTAGSFANQVRQLTSSLKELSVELGKAIIPFLKTVLTVIRGIVPKVIAWVKANGEMIVTIAKVLVVIAALLIAIKALTVAMTLYTAIQSVATLGPAGLIVFAATLAAAAAGAAFMASKLKDLAAEAANAAKVQAALNKGIKETNELARTPAGAGGIRRGGFRRPLSEAQKRAAQEIQRGRRPGEQFEPTVRKGEREGRAAQFVGIANLFKQVQLAALNRKRERSEAERLKLERQSVQILEQIRNSLGREGGAVTITP